MGGLDPVEPGTRSNRYVDASNAGVQPDALSRPYRCAPRLCLALAPSNSPRCSGPHRMPLGCSSLSVALVQGCTPRMIAGLIRSRRILMRLCDYVHDSVAVTCRRSCWRLRVVPLHVWTSRLGLCRSSQQASGQTGSPYSGIHRIDLKLRLVESKFWLYCLRMTVIRLYSLAWGDPRLVDAVNPSRAFHTWHHTPRRWRFARLIRGDPWLGCSTLVLPFGLFLAGLLRRIPSEPHD